MNPLFGDNLIGKNFITPEGIFSQEQLLIAQILHDYDPTLSLVRIENPQEGQMNCAVLCTPFVGPAYVVTYVNQADVNYRLIAQIYAADMQKAGRPLEDQLRANDMARELVESLRREEIMAEQAEFAATVLKSPLHKYRHNGKVYQ